MGGNYVTLKESTCHMANVDKIVERSIISSLCQVKMSRNMPNCPMHVWLRRQKSYGDLVERICLVVKGSQQKLQACARAHLYTRHHWFKATNWNTPGLKYKHGLVAKSRLQQQLKFIGVFFFVVLKIIWGRSHNIYTCIYVTCSYVHMETCICISSSVTLFLSKLPSHVKKNIYTEGIYSVYRAFMYLAVNSHDGR